MAVRAPENLAATAQSPNLVLLEWDNKDEYDTIDIQRRATIQTLDLLISGYTDCVETDIGKQVKDDAAEIGILVAYNNTIREWVISTSSTVVSGSAMTITGGTGAGTADGNSVGGSWELLEVIEGFKTNYLDDDLYIGTEYCYKIRGCMSIPEAPYEECSGWTDAACATTYVGLQAPTDLEVIPVDDTKADLVFTINSLIEDSVRVERKPDGGSYKEIAILASKRDFFRDQGQTLTLLSAGYVSCVASDIGKQVKDDGDEVGVLLAYDNTNRIWSVYSTTIIADASVITITGGTGAGTADGNSASLIKGQKYFWQIRVKRDTPSEYSDYSNEDDATTIDNPLAPSNFAIPSVTKEDKKLRLMWADNSDNETGFRIEKSDTGVFGGEEETFVVGADITEFLIAGLDPSTQYWFRIYAYNAAGDSSYDSVNGTTLAVYVPTEFEKWIRTPKIKPIILCEINPGIELSGFTIVSGKTYTYELTITDRAIIDIEEVFEGGDEYTEKSSINEVEANASSFWFDASVRKIYVHTSNGTNPSNFFIEGRFWLYLTNAQDGTITFNNNYYYPFLSLDNIPSMSQAISPLYIGSLMISSGIISFKNDEHTAQKFFDKRYEDYLWRDAKVILKIGKKGFIYDQHEEIFTSLIDKEKCNDSLFSLSLKDLRANLSGKIPVNKYKVTDFPLMDTDQEKKVIPRVFKRRTDVEPICVDTARSRWKFHDGQIQQVHKVTINSVEKTVDTHYYVDYQRGIITFDDSAGVEWAQDIIEIDFTGIVDSALAEITNGAEIFKYIMNNIMGIPNTELDLDSIYETKYAYDKKLSFPILKEENLGGIIHKIENSTKSWSFQDEKGRIGLQVAQTTPASNAVYVENFHISEAGHSQEKGTKYLFKEINVYYMESSKEGKKKWEVFTKLLPAFVNKYGKRKPLPSLDIYTYFISDVPASLLADDIENILIELEEGFIYETLPWVLYGRRVGDLIKLSRNRFYSSSGIATEITVRLLELNKIISSGESTIVGVIV